MTADVGNAFPTTPNQKKVWCTAGPEFETREGSKIEIQQAMYGLAGSSRAFADFLVDSISRLGFAPSQADPDLWLKKTKYGRGQSHCRIKNPARIYCSDSIRVCFAEYLI
jgi:hypothetical protein